MGELPIEDIRALIRLWRSESQHDTEDNDYADGYNEGLNEAADDLAAVLKGAGHTL